MIVPKDKYLDIDGLRLHYMDWGNENAQPMILLHGLQDCARSWDSFAHGLSSDYRVLALDHRGHGDSDWASKDRYRLCDYVTDISALVAELGLVNVVVVGHSAGGRNAFEYALSSPSNVEALVIVDIDPDANNEESKDMFAQYYKEGDEWDCLDDVVDRLRSRQPSSSEEMLFHQASNMTLELPNGRRVWKRDRTLLTSYERPDLWYDWYRIICPLLIVRGRQSKLLTQQVAVKMRESVARARLVELEGGGHWFYQERPEEFEATVRWFLEAIL